MRTRRSIDGGRVVVVSPHLDDAALSLGATITRAAHAGAQVTVVTAFSGDPDSEAPLGPWDRLCGFASAAEAARERRAEDVRACEIMGATPVWLPFTDEQYAGERSAQEVWDALAPLLGDADVVLVPGFPLVHDDHAWLAETILRRCGDAPVGLYVEQPYAVNVAIGRGRSPKPVVQAARIALATRLGRVVKERPAARIAGLVPREGDWVGVRPSRAERDAKSRAILAYASQVAALEGQLLRRIRLHEAVAGGERMRMPRLRTGRERT